MFWTLMCAHMCWYSIPHLGVCGYLRRGKPVQHKGWDPSLSAATPPFQVLSLMLQYKEGTKSVFTLSSLYEWMQPVTKRLAAPSEPLIAFAPGYHRKHMVEEPSNCPRLCTGAFGSFGEGERKVSPLQLYCRWSLHTVSLNTKQRREKVWRHDKQTAEC